MMADTAEMNKQQLQFTTRASNYKVAYCYVKTSVKFHIVIIYAAVATQQFCPRLLLPNLEF